MTTAGARRPTLDAVAAAAGVTKSTASKVLNGRPNVSAATRQRVEAAMAQLGYVPSTGPRGATARHSIVVVFQTLADIYATRVLEGILTSARSHDIDVLVEVTTVSDEGSVPLSPDWIRLQAAHQRTGIIVVTSELTTAQRTLTESLNLPVVHIDPLNPHADLTVSVGSTNFAGGMQATSHLLELGHRRIAFAGGPPSSMSSTERRQGYLSVMTAHGGHLDDALVLSRSYSYGAGLEMADQLLDLAEPPTAIFAASDSIALGVLASAQRHGLRVPQDLSVVGFDDTYAATTSAPALTTVRQPIVEMGRVALRTLLQLANGETADSHHVQLLTELVVRESTAPPR